MYAFGSKIFPPIENSLPIVPPSQQLPFSTVGEPFLSTSDFMNNIFSWGQAGILQPRKYTTITILNKTINFNWGQINLYLINLLYTYSVINYKEARTRGEKIKRYRANLKEIIPQEWTSIQSTSIGLCNNC